MVEGRDHVRAHFQHEHGQREHRGHDQRAAQALQFGRLAPGRGSGGAARIQRAGLVAGGGHRLDQRLRRHRARDFDMGAFGRQVDAGRAHARHRLQRALDPPHARSAGHAGDGQFHGAGGHGVAGLLDRLHRRADIRRAGKAHVGALGGQVDHRVADARHRLQRALDTPHARGASHALDRQADGARRGRAG